MAQKVLGGRLPDQSSTGRSSGSSGDTLEVKVDQVVLARAPGRALADAVASGLKRTKVEVAVAYDTVCVTAARAAVEGRAFDRARMLGHGLLVAKPGIGYPGAVHLERFASPGRLCVTDEPRLASVGGVGMLALVVSTAQLGHALAHGTVVLRRPRSVQVLLSGRARPFVCARDIGLELVRRGLGDVVRKVDSEHGAPVVLEIAGPSVRLLSVGERAVLAALAPRLGAAAAVFVSDERSEVYLRDQRRSKAHRALVPDAGAPCDEVVHLDLGAVDPLLLDASGQVRSVRDLSGTPVTQVVLGGDGGTTLRDLLVAATLLKSKRVPSSLELLLAVPSRQVLEVLASSGALTDLVAAGARIIEPDGRVMTGEVYPPPGEGLSVRSSDPEPRLSGPAGFVVASAETLAYAVAAGAIGDPRMFRRPVRVTVPRVLPTDDVLVVRERRAGEAGAKKALAQASAPSKPREATIGWKGAQTLQVVDAAALGEGGAPRGVAGESVAVCSSLDQVRGLAARAPEIAPRVRAVVAEFVPSGLVSSFAASGIAVFAVPPAELEWLRRESSLALPPPSRWTPETKTVAVPVGGGKTSLTWLALGIERAWTTGAAPTRSPAKTQAG